MEFPMGFRFLLTDEESIKYLRTKNGGGDTRYVDRFISTVKICSYDPWELPSKSMILSRDQFWYFFGIIEKKYNTGGKQIRTTNSGFWKITGKPTKFMSKSGNPPEKICEKSVLVFLFKGSTKKTNWVMHEYHLSSTLNPNVAYTLCKVMFKGAESEISSPPPATEISHSSVTDVTNSSSGLSPGSEVGQSQNLTAFQGFSSESLPREELQNPPQFSGFPHLEGETELDAMLRTLGNLSEDDFNKMLNANEQSTNVSMQQDCSNHMPRKPVTGVMVDVTSDDSDSDSVSATTGSIHTWSTCDSFGSSNQRIDHITDLEESPNSTIEFVPIAQEVSQVLGPETETGEHKLSPETIKKKTGGSFYGMIQRLVKKLNMCSSF